MTNSRLPPPAHVERLLQTNLVMTVRQLRQALNGRARSSVFPLLCELKAAYGTPLALGHDMGRAILKAVATVFPTVPDYICHFHSERRRPA